MDAKQGWFATDDGHLLYWERHGTPGAEPIFFLHGGPGGRSTRHHLEFFDLRCFEVILFDQRGCGRSMPYGECRLNTTSACVEDIDCLRQYLGFDKISLLGISWGSWLATLYQQHYPCAVGNTTLASLFVPFTDNVRAYDQTLRHSLSTVTAGAVSIAPHDIHQALKADCPAKRRQAALHWMKAMMMPQEPFPGGCLLEEFVDENAVQAVRLELHYHINQYFFIRGHEQPILNDNTRVIQGIHDRFGMASLRWLRQHQHVDCHLVHAGHDIFHGALLKTVRDALKRHPPG